MPRLLIAFLTCLCLLAICSCTQEQEGKQSRSEERETDSKASTFAAQELAPSAKLKEEIVFASPDASFVTLLPEGYHLGQALSKAQILALLESLDAQNESILEVIELTAELKDDPKLLADLVPRLCLACAAHQGPLNGRDIMMVDTYIVSKILGNELCAASAISDLGQIMGSMSEEERFYTRRMLEGVLAKYPA